MHHFLFNEFFCILDLTKSGDYVHFLDNNQTFTHQSIIYAIRQLTSEEMDEFCFEQTFNRSLLSILNQPVNFSSNYAVRVYQSACFYLDSSNNWQADGLLVSRESFFNPSMISLRLII